MKATPALFFFFTSMLTLTTLHAKGGTTVFVTSQLQQPADAATGAPAAPPLFLSDVAVSGTDSYVNSRTLVSYFQAGGDWQLDMTGSTTRRAWLDLADPSQPFNQQYVKAMLTTHCKNNGLTGVADLKGVGSSTTCPMTFRINWGSDSSVFYRIGFNTIVRPGTGDVKWTCLAVDQTNSCVEWSGMPADNDYKPGDGRSTGRLMKVTTSKTGTQTETSIGDYDVNFKIHLVK